MAATERALRRGRAATHRRRPTAARTAKKQPRARRATPEQKAAATAGLVYVEDGSAGYSRVRKGRGFAYVGPNGVVRDPSTLARIRALAIPPAWTNVWITSNPNAHLQATGRDARGRKQYRYHDRWRAVRDEAKYARMSEFAAALPGLRRRVDADLAKRGLPREKVAALLVRLLERTLIRIGNEEYARTNESYGLTTLRDRHVRVEGGRIVFRFRGKSGKDHAIDVRDERAARIVRRCRDLPGQELFQYIDDDGETRTIGSAEVNEYLREATGTPFTAKDFRTWAGTVLAAMALALEPPPESDTESSRATGEACTHVAAALGNTPAMARKCYIHPAIFESYRDGTLSETWEERKRVKKARLAPEEAAVASLLRDRRNTGTQPERPAC